MTSVNEIPKYIDQASINLLHTEGFYATHSPATWNDYLSSAKANDLVAMGPARGDRGDYSVNETS